MLEVGAIGVPDPRSGESVRAILVKKNPSLTEQSLLTHWRQHLAPYKVPKSVEWRTQPLPKIPIGKIVRRELRAESIAMHQEAPAAAQAL